MCDRVASEQLNTETLYIDEINRLNAATEQFCEALEADFEKLFTDEVKQTLLRVGAECAELNREERRDRRDLRKTIRNELRKLTSYELTEILEHIENIKRGKE